MINKANTPRTAFSFFKEKPALGHAYTLYTIHVPWTLLTSVAAVEVGKYSEQEGGGDGDGVTTLLQHLLISPHYLTQSEDDIHVHKIVDDLTASCNTMHCTEHISVTFVYMLYYALHFCW